MIDPLNPDFGSYPTSCGRPRFGYAPAEVARCPEVSIITVVMTGGGGFHETVRGVLGQSFQDWEWIVVDAAETNAQLELSLSQFTAQDARIRVFREAGKSEASLRNWAADRGAGRILLFLNEADILEPTALEKWIWAFEAHTDAAFLNAYTVSFGAEESLDRSIFPPPEQMLDSPCCIDTFAIRHVVFRIVGGYDPSLGAGDADWEFWLRCAVAQQRGETFPEYLVWRRTRVDRTPGKSLEQMRGVISWIHNIYDRDVLKLPPRVWEDPARIPRVLPFHNRLQKARRRLLFVLSGFIVGGAEKAALDIVQQLVERGWEVTIVATEDCEHEWLPEFARHTSDIFVLQSTLKQPSFFSVDYPRFLLYLVQSRSVDAVLLSNSWVGYACLPYLRACNPEVAFLDLRHAAFYPQTTLEAHALLDLTIVSTASVRKEMIQQHEVPFERVEVYYTNVDATLWHPDPEARAARRAELGISPEIPVIVYVARLFDSKQPQVLAEVVRQLRDRDLNCVALVVGTGPLLDWLQEFVWKHGLERHLRVLGHIASEDMPATMAAADLFFLPSRMEGISIAAFEAMACGLTVVSADIGGMRELVTQDCGHLIPQASPDEETAAYVSILSQLLTDPKRLKLLGHQSHERIKSHFRLEQMGERIEQLILRGIEMNRTSPRVPSLADIGQIANCFGIMFLYWKRCHRHLETATYLNSCPESLASQLSPLRTARRCRALARRMIQVYRVTRNRLREVLRRGKRMLRHSKRAAG